MLIVTFYANGGRLDDDISISTDDGFFSFPNDPEKEGYTFEGWYTDLDGTKKFNTNSDCPITDNLSLYAKYSPIQYSVTFLDDDFNPAQIIYANYNEPLKEDPTEPVKKGYTFDGWYLNASFTDRYIIGTNVTKNLSVYPKFSATKLSVWFDTGEGGPTIPTQIISYEDVPEQPNDPEIYGYDFDGWYKDYLFKESYNWSEPITKDTTIYAKFNVKYVLIRYLDEDNYVIQAEKSIPYGTILSRPKDPTRTGKRFSYWSSNGVKYTFTERVEENTTIVAHFDDIKCTVLFDTNGGYLTDDMVQEVVYNDKVSIPNEPTKDGSTFLGWYVSKAFNNQYNFDSPVTSDITLYAKWKVDIFTVSYLVDGETFDSRNVQYGSTAPVPLTTPTKEFYQFLGWYNNNDTAYDFSTRIYEPTSIYAKFSKENTTVLFNTAGGSTILPVIVNLGEQVSEPAPPTKKGHTFEGWYEDAKYQYKYDFQALITSATTLFAKWTVDTYNVTINLNNDNNDSLSYDIEYGNKLTPIENPMLGGYTFMGWETDDGVPFDFSTPIESNLVINAKFSEYVADTSDDLLTMINSGNFYKGSSIANAMQKFVASYIKDNTIGDWKVEDLSVIYDYSLGSMNSFTNDIYYNITYTDNILRCDERQLTYNIPLSKWYLECIIPIMLGTTGPTRETKMEIGNYLNSYLKNIRNGNYDPI